MWRGLKREFFTFLDQGRIASYWAVWLGLLAFLGGLFFDHQMDTTVASGITAASGLVLGLLIITPALAFAWISAKFRKETATPLELRVEKAERRLSVLEIDDDLTRVDDELQQLLATISDAHEREQAFLDWQKSGGSEEDRPMGAFNVPSEAREGVKLFYERLNRLLKNFARNAGVQCPPLIPVDGSQAGTPDPEVVVQRHQEFLAKVEAIRAAASKMSEQ